jgi:hypothetical protein
MPRRYVVNSETMHTLLLMLAPHHQPSRTAGTVTFPGKSPVNQGDKSKFREAIHGALPPTCGCGCGCGPTVMVRWCAPAPRV